MDSASEQLEICELLGEIPFWQEVRKMMEEDIEQAVAPGERRDPNQEDPFR